MYNEVTSLTIYTGSNGKKGCTCNCEGCSQEKYGNEHNFYQGNISQIKHMLPYLPNLKRAIILGNPDPSVDSKFCNRVAKKLIEKDVRVRFSTSGFNALETVKNVLEGIDLNYVDYYSFSIDSMNPDILYKLKGQTIDYSDVYDAINFCKKNGVTVKIQPTLWKVNMNDYYDIINDFYSKGVRWFSFHAGSFETIVNKKVDLQHIEPWDWRIIFEDIIRICREKGLKLHIPYLFLYQSELNEFFKMKGKTQCDPQELINTQVWLEERNIRTTHCPLLLEHQLFEYPFGKDRFKETNLNKADYGYCPANRECLGNEIVKKSLDDFGYRFKDDKGNDMYSVCRFYNYNLG